MKFELEHPSGCDCPAPTVIDGGIVVLDVHTCPRCLSWERQRRNEQLDLLTEEGVASAAMGDDSLGPYEKDPSEILAEIRSVDPSF